MGWRWTSIASIAMVFVAVFSYSAAAQAPECFSVAATIIGTGGADELTGTAGPDVIVGLGGIDIIRGGGGDDILCGGAGADRLIGGPDDDLLNAGAGRDAVAHGDSPNAIELDLVTGSSIGWGSDTLVSIEDAVGSPYDDILVGDSDENRFQGGAGADAMHGRGGDDFLGAAHRTDSDGVSFGECTDLGRGPDLLVGGDGADELSGCGGEDIARGSAGRDTIEGGGGDDDLDGGAGNDHVSGGSSISKFGVSIHCRPDKSGSDRLSGQGGNDTLLGCDGSDRIRGDSGNDLLSGGNILQIFLDLEACTTRDSRRDRLEGGHGRDELWGCGGADLLIGGGGRDTAQFSGAERPVRVRLHRRRALGEGRDRLRDIENITGSEHADTIFGNRQANVLRGGMRHSRGGSGEFYSGRGRDRIFGRAGNDVIIGGLHDDQLDGGRGRDRAVYDLTYADHTVVVDLSQRTSSGAEGSDEIERIEDVTAWFDAKIVGNDGPNRLVSRSYYGPDGVLIGRGGRDVLVAGLDDDVVRGGEGRDVLDGGPGRDRLYGGPDLDRCKSGADYRNCEIRS